MSLTALSFFCIDHYKEATGHCNEKEPLLGFFFQSKIYLTLVVKRIFSIICDIFKTDTIFNIIHSRGVYHKYNAYAICALSIIK